MAKGSGGTRGAAGGGRSSGGALSSERIQQIYKGALNVFEDAVTTWQNFNNEDPNTSIKDAMDKIGRAKNAYKWTQDNGKGQDFGYAAQNKVNANFKGSADSGIQAQQVYDMVVKGKTLNQILGI
jgi:dsRNA-specific ribonuclease